MYTKEQYWKSIENEVRVIKHLATKVPAGTLDYRPTPGQRSTLELLQYISGCGVAPMKAIVTNDVKAYAEYDAFRASTTLENFASQMDTQLSNMKDLFSQVTDEDFKKEANFYGVRTVAEHLVESVLKNFAAYRMQLFLYAKSNGAYISTMDLWAGMDTPTKQD